MAFYEITLRSVYKLQQCINRFPYWADTSGFQAPSALELLVLAGFIPDPDTGLIDSDTLFASIIALVSGGVFFVSAEARELYSISDFYEAGYSPGFQGGEAVVGSAPFLAFGLTSSRVLTTVKRGSKRFVGVTEDDIDEGGALSTDAITRLALVGERMSANFSGESSVYEPATFGFEPYTTASGRTAYRKFTDPDDQLEHTAHPVVYSVMANVRSQTSRQYGRGG